MFRSTCVASKAQTVNEILWDKWWGEFCECRWIFHSFSRMLHVQKCSVQELILTSWLDAHCCRPYPGSREGLRRCWSWEKGVGGRAGRRASAWVHQASEHKRGVDLKNLFYALSHVKYMRLQASPKALWDIKTSTLWAVGLTSYLTVRQEVELGTLKHCTGFILILLIQFHTFQCLSWQSFRTMHSLKLKITIEFHVKTHHSIKTKIYDKLWGLI